MNNRMTSIGSITNMIMCKYTHKAFYMMKIQPKIPAGEVICN